MASLQFLYLIIDSILFFLSILKISKKYRQGAVFTTTDPCPELIKYSLNVLKKKIRVSDISNTYKTCFMKINIESSLLDIWIRIRFLEINASPSLLIIP